MDASGEAIEQGYWQAVQGVDTIAAYDMYLDDYPRGGFVSEAQARIAALKTEPVREAQALEQALRLSRNLRRDIQRGLSLLGFDPRGVDGVFGPGSRQAIGAWQTANGFSATSYLTEEQIALLRAQSEEEARQRRVEAERQDRRYWRELGRGADEASLRAYLERYPDGLFADVALDRLEEIEEDRRAEAAQAERNAWDKARTADTAAAYREFLNAYPQGSFAPDARQRLAELVGPDDSAAEIARARQEERRFTSTLVGRALIEQRLVQFNGNPGPVDGKFTRETRQAIQSFQRANNLPVTGYISEETMVRLMAGGR